MSHTFKPGDVAMVTCKTPPHSFAASRGPKGWNSLDPSIGFASDYDTTAARPLVVLDLSEEPVEGDVPGRNEPQLLVSMLRETAENFFTPDAAALAQKVADQIEAQILPKPDEPIGLGAVVEDADGKRWTRYDERDPQPWWRTSTGDPNEPIECRFAYDDIAAVRVLSKGVQEDSR